MINPWLLAFALVQESEQSPRSRPVELLQAQSCKPVPTDTVGFVTAMPIGRLLSLHEVTPCLSDIFKRLQEETLRLVGSDAKAVLHVGVGRGFGEAALLFSAPDDPQIHYAENFSSLTDTLSAEWREYKSPDGDLGWSGFVLVIDKGGTQVRFSTAPYPSLGAYETAMQLEAEFFPNKVAAGRTSMPEAKR